MLAWALTGDPIGAAWAADKQVAPVDPRSIIAETQALGPGSVDDLIPLEIGGIKQWISVRGTRPDNPILLFIHGGPGSPMMPESWTFQSAMGRFLHGGAMGPTGRRQDVCLKHETA